MFHCLINQTKSVAISSAIYERVNNTPNHSRKKYASTQFNSTSVKTSFSGFLFIVYWNACTYLANNYWLCCTVDYFSSYISMSGSFEVVICLPIYLSQHLLNFCLEFSLFRYICVFYCTGTFLRSINFEREEGDLPQILAHRFKKKITNRQNPNQ